MYSVALSEPEALARDAPSFADASGSDFTGYLNVQKPPLVSSVYVSSSATLVCNCVSQFTRRLPRKMRPSLNMLKNVSRTARAQVSSSVKRVRGQSQLAPMERSWPRMQIGRAHV